MDRRVGALVAVALLIPVFLSAQKQTKLVFVSAVDGTGAPVTNLTPADFEVSVGGVKQPVTRATYGAPMRIVLLVDSSTPTSQMTTEIRSALNTFVDTAPPEAEIALITISGQIGVRQAPTLDRALLHTAVNRFVSQGGANSFLDILLETDKRFLKNAPDRWPVFMIVTTDSGEMSGVPNIEPFNTFVNDFRVRAGSAHAVVIHGTKTGLISDMTQNLVQNTGGIYEVMAIANALGDKLKAMAQKIAADRQTMVNRYVVEYTGDAKSTQQVEVKVPRGGITIQLSARRPF